MHCNQYGCLLSPLVASQTGSLTVSSFATIGQVQPTMKALGYKDCSVVPAMVATPAVLRRKGAQGRVKDAVVFLKIGDPEFVLCFMGRRAFGQVTDYCLSKLLKDLDIEHRDDGLDISTVWGKIERLVRWSNPDMSDEEVVQVLAMRATRTSAAASVKKSKLSEVNMQALDTVCDSSDKTMLQKGVESEGKEGDATMRVVSYMMARGMQVPANLRHLKRKAEAEAKKNTQEQIKKKVHLTRQKAKQFLPKAKGVVLQPYPHLGRYQMYYPTDPPPPPRSHCERFGPKGNSEQTALTLCLEWCWHKHTAAIGEQCPYEFVRS